MAANYTAVIQQSGGWWIGWVEEVPGVNSQAETREKLIENLHSALEEAIEMNRAEARAACDGLYEEVSLSARNATHWFPSQNSWLFPRSRGIATFLVGKLREWTSLRRAPPYRDR